MSQEVNTAGWHRLSSRVIWVDLVQTLLSLIPAAVAVWWADGNAADVAWPLLAVAAFGIIGAVADAVRWLFTWYRITDTHVELRTGVIFRQHRTLRRQRIRSVDVEAKLRHRIARLRLVKVGAGQHTAAGESALTLDALTAVEARELQAALLSGRNGTPASTPPASTAPAGGDAAGDSSPGEPGVAAAAMPRDTGDTAPTLPAAGEPDTGPEPAEPAPRTIFAAFRPGWVIYNMFNIWAYLMALGLIWGGYWLLTSFGVDLDSFVAGLIDWESLGWIGSITIAFVVITVVGAVGLTLNYFVEFWNFELARVPGPEGTQLRTRKGLFTTREVNRDENRIRGIELKEPLFWRWLGVTDTTVITTGLDVWSMSEPTAILPRTDNALARATAAAVLGVEEEIFGTTLHRHPGAALRRRLWWATLSALVLAGILGTVVALSPLNAVWFWSLAIYWPLALLGAVIAYRNLGHAIVGDYVIKRSGMLNRTTVVLRRDAVSTIAVSESLFQRRLGLRTISAMTAAGTGAYRFPDIAAADSTTVAQAAAPGLLTGFLEDRPPSQPNITAPPARRLVAPDLARGVMLLLIAMAYASVYIGAEFGAHGAGDPWWDRLAVGVSALFLDNRAFPMFAILFGYGLAWSVRRRQDRGVAPRDIRRGLRRRAWWLLGIGAIHAILIYSGEILTSYGLAILLTGWLLFRSVRTLRVAAWITGVFYLLTVPLTMLFYAWGRTMEPVAPVAGYTSLEDWATRLVGVPISPIYLAIAYPLLLLVILGYLAGRAKLIEEPVAHRRQLRTIAVVGVGVSVLGGLPSALVFSGVVSAGWQAEGVIMALQVLTGILGGAGYIALFTLYADRLAQLWGRGVAAVAAMGKRSLTFYLLNSGLVALILHPDLIGLPTGALGALVVAVAAWLISLGLAVWLEQAGRSGPMEALLRRGIYGRGDQRRGGLRVHPGD